MAFVLPVLVSCGGDDSGPGNFPPVASFTATPASGNAPLTVLFDAAASSDADGSITGYSWNFGDGSVSGTGVAPSHLYTTAGAFTVTLTVADDAGGTASSTRQVVVSGAPSPEVVVSGHISYERVPFATAASRGLDYPRTAALPARNVVVELIAAANQTILRSTSTDTAGGYSFTAPAGMDVFVRAKAQSTDPVGGGAAGSWDIRVRDNTGGNALYVLDGSTFNTGTTNHSRNLLAASGWGGGFAGVYLNPRSAAPFAILDTLRASTGFVLDQTGEAVDFPPLDAFWSPDNRPSSLWNPANGDIVSTGYAGGATGSSAAGLYILGADGNDTDEYDVHVIAHEFQHYLEDRLARADSPGGEHSLDERLDLRLAFSEGFANAFSAMVLADPSYRDSFGAAQAADFGFDLEDDVATVAGWFSERSVQSIVWDLFDPANEDGDAVSTGFAPMYEVFRTDLVDTPALTSIFPFIVALERRPGVPVAAVDSLLASQDIVADAMDEFASTETNDGGIRDVLPVYAAMVLNGPPARLCANTEAGTGNKIGNRRFVAFSVPTPRLITVQVQALADAASPPADPDLVLFRGGSGFFDISETGGSSSETYQQSVPAGDYVVEVYDFDHVQPAGPQPRPRTCMNISING